jgi:chromosomal replication initiation ATPase DnaA
MEKIKVALRMRPFSGKERAARHELGWHMNLENNVTTASKPQYYSKPFIFDYCFNETHKNEDVYRTCCKEIVLSAMDGINTTLFVYGQTGAGKTHTMLGPPDETIEQRYTGIIFQALEDVFEKVRTSQEEKFYFTCSYIEIYNEMIYDLLSKADRLNDHLTIYEDVANQRFKIKNQTKVRIESLSDILKILTYGEQNRKYAETYFNHKSSRSHTIFSVYIQNIKVGKMCLLGNY